MIDSILFYINGIEFQVQNGELPHDYTLLRFIREKALLTGTKLSCGEGGCAICTVTVSTNDQDPGRPVASCLVPVYMCHGWNITTVEGLGDEQSGYHPIQKTLADNNGSQCGFCSPGIVMTMYGALQQDKSLSKDKIEQTLAGNMCRCTGYRAIVDSMQKVLDIEDTLKCTGKCADCKRPTDKPSHVLATTSEDGSTWYRPSTIEQLRELIKQHKASSDLRIISGHTGFSLRKSDEQIKYYVLLADITEMESIKRSTQSVEIGAAVTLTKLIRLFVELSSQSAEYLYLKEAAEYLSKVANLQIRNFGSWAGNLMMKSSMPSFPSDLFILMESIGAFLNLYDCSSGSYEHISVDDLPTTDMNGKYIESVTIYPKPNWCLVTYEVSPTHRNSLSMLSLAFGVEVDSSFVVKGRPKVVYAGLCKNLSHALEVEEILSGGKLDDQSLLSKCYGAIDDIQLEAYVYLPPVDFRRKLAKSLLKKAILKLTAGENHNIKLAGESLNRSDVSHGSVTFDTVPSEYPMTQPTPKLDSVKQTAGEAQFTGDLPAMAGQLEAVFVTATIGSGEISSIDTSEAEKMPGVVRILTAKDIPGRNMLYSSDSGEEPLLADKEVSYHGQPIAIISAITQSQALGARKKVKVEYRNVKKPIVTIKQAIKANSFFKLKTPGMFDVLSGDPQGAMKTCDTVVSGSLEVGEQYPMYMESQNALVSIQEGYVVAYSSTQLLQAIRDCISRLLNISANMVDARVRRVGGGFGGKQARSVYPAAAAAVVSYLTKRPVKMTMTLEDNMAIYGRRNPIRIDYKIGATKDLKIQSLEATMYESCGFMVNASKAKVLAKRLDSCYYLPNCDIKVHQCKTNQPVHSYIRAPGVASAEHFIEQMLDHLASELNVPGEKLREANLYQEGQTTPYKQVMVHCHIEQLYKQLKDSCKYDERLKEVEEFNKDNEYRKKGISLMPMRYGMQYFPVAEYLVHVMINDSDGSVVIIHGGVELGQGINTKVVQVAAKTLGIPMDMIKVHPTSSVYNLQSAITGGSVTSDLNCVAVQKACEQLVEKLKSYREKESDWKSAVAKASGDFVDLHAKQHISKCDVIDPSNRLFEYHVFGVTCSEVELDCLTGQYIIQRVDLLYDAGRSYSPEIDAGQIQGAFVMGMGLYLYEEIKYDPHTGKNMNNNTWKYHIPMVGDIPFEFNVEMVKNLPNIDFSLRSKVVGEPPLLMAESIVLALKKAINEYRKSKGLTGLLTVDAPFTLERIFMSCQESDF